jgi:hypothetical protein
MPNRFYFTKFFKPIGLYLSVIDLIPHEHESDPQLADTGSRLARFVQPPRLKEINCMPRSGEMSLTVVLEMFRSTSAMQASGLKSLTLVPAICSSFNAMPCNDVKSVTWECAIYRLLMGALCRGERSEIGWLFAFNVQVPS